MTGLCRVTHGFVPPVNQGKQAGPRLALREPLLFTAVSRCKEGVGVTTWHFLWWCPYSVSDSPKENLNLSAAPSAGLKPACGDDPPHSAFKDRNQSFQSSLLNSPSYVFLVNQPFDISLNQYFLSWANRRIHINSTEQLINCTLARVGTLRLGTSAWKGWMTGFSVSWR